MCVCETDHGFGAELWDELAQFLSKFLSPNTCNANVAIALQSTHDHKWLVDYWWDNTFLAYSLLRHTTGAGSCGLTITITWIPPVLFPPDDSLEEYLTTGAGLDVSFFNYGFWLFFQEYFFFNTPVLYSALHRTNFRVTTFLFLVIALRIRCVSVLRKHPLMYPRRSTCLDVYSDMYVKDEVLLYTMKCYTWWKTLK